MKSVFKKYLSLGLILIFTTVLLASCGSKVEFTFKDSGESDKAAEQSAADTNSKDVSAEDLGALDVNGSESTTKDNTSSNDSSAAVKDGYLSYQNAANGLKINYENSWTKTEGSYGSLVAFMSPIENSSDVFSENVNIVIQDLSSQPMTLSEYTDLSIKQIKQMISGIAIETTNSCTLAGSDAASIVYTGNTKGYNLKWMQVYAIKNNKAYLITYTADESNFDKYIDVVNEMINSFEIK